MYPVILALFAALGVGRLTLLALQLSAEVNNQSAEGEGHASSSSNTTTTSSSGNAVDERLEGHQQPLSPRTSQMEQERALRAVVAAMATLEKPVKMLQRGDFHYLCIWREADFHPQMSEADIVRAAAARQELIAEQVQREAQTREDSGSGFQQELFRTLQDMTAFFDQLVVGKALEPLLQPPPSSREEMDEGRAGQTRRHAATGGGWLQEQEQEQGEEQGEDEEVEEQEGGFWSWLIGSKPAASSSGALGGAHPDSTIAAVADSSSVCSTRHAAAAAAVTGCGGEDGEEHSVCLVCYEREQDAVLLNCGHGGTCFKCACDVYRRSGECPLCRARVDQIVQIGRRRQHLPNGLAVVPVTGPWW